MNTMRSRRHAGKYLAGVSLGPNCFFGVSTLNELETYGLKRPTALEDAKVKEMKIDPRLRAAHNVRSEVQRRFDAARRKRSHAFANYLSRLYSEKGLGAFAPVTLYSPFEGTLEQLDGVDNAELMLEHTSPLVNLDGETQTEARFILREASPESGEFPIMFVLYHGIPDRHAATIMHDFNFFARPVTEAKIAALNANGLLTRIVIEVLDELRIQPEQIARLNPTPNKKQIASYAGMIAGAAGAQVGRLVTNNLSAEITRLNNLINGIDPEQHLKPFMRHALTLAQASTAIGKSKPTTWALAGGHYHDTGELLDEQRWLELQSGFNIKVPRGTLRVKAVKRENALRSAGLEIV